MNTNQRIKLANRALRGTSIGDAFGESFFGETDKMLAYIRERRIPETSWEFTDDTIMAISIYDQLRKNGTIDQDQLAQRFVVNHDKDVNRGYGSTARRILREIGEGGNWKEVSQSVFEGMGSMGNGASMRVSPIGAFYFDDVKRVKELAIKSAEITHSNIEGISGAIAVALATAIATKMKLRNEQITPIDFVNLIVEELPDTDTRSKIKKSTSVPYTYNIETVKSILGDGSKIMVQDTVPFSIWCAAYNLENFEEAIWKAVSILGDRDTICAIVGGITIMSAPENTVPANWLDSVEDFASSQFQEEQEN